jgi:hypothetical protein
MGTNPEAKQMDIYITQRGFWLHHLRQLRSMIRNRHPQTLEVRSLLKRSQAQAARLRASAYAAARSAA